MENQLKRHRGAQPGNRNAVKHGFYAKNLNPAQHREYLQAADIQGLDEEIALLRVAVKNAATGGDIKNLKPLIRAVNALDKLIRTRYRVGYNQYDQLKQAVSNVVRDIMVPLGIVGAHVAVANKPAKNSSNRTETDAGQSQSNAGQSQSNAGRIETNNGNMKLI